MPERAPGRAGGERPADQLARRAPHRGARPRRRAGHGRLPLRARGGRGGRPPPAALRARRARARPRSPSGSPALLPDLPLEESLELTAVYSLAGGLPPGQTMMIRPPFRAPHHSASRASVLGGGTGRVRPGEISRAHHGVPVPRRVPAVSDRRRRGAARAARERGGHDRPRRGGGDASRPGRMVVLACNPCPCGDYHPADPGHQCTCSEVARREYRRKLTGPVIDRIDITRHVEPVPPHQLHDPLAVPESLGDGPRSRVERRGRGSGSATRARRGGSTATCPGPSLRRSLAARRRRLRAGRRRACTPAASPVAARPGCTGWPGPSPTCRGVRPTRARARPTRRCGCDRERRCCVAERGRGGAGQR